MKLTHAAAAAALLAALTGCSSAPATAPAPSPTPSLSLQDNTFLHEVYSHTQTLANTSSDADIVDLAHKACAALDEGNSVKELVAAITDGTTDPTERKDMDYTIGAGIGTYCPQHAAAAAKEASK